MFQTIGNVQKVEAVGLQQYVDNRCGELRVGLRSLTCTVGWYNVEEGLSFLEWHRDDQLTKPVKVPPGLIIGLKSLRQCSNQVKATCYSRLTKRIES